MPEKRRYLQQQIQIIEVHGIDLLAQVEALLRGIADYRRHVVRLQGTSRTPASDGSRRTAAAALRKRILELKADSEILCDTLDDAERVAESLDRMLRSGRTA